MPASPRSETFLHDPGHPARPDRNTRRPAAAVARRAVRPVACEPRVPGRGPDRPVPLGRRGRSAAGGHGEAPRRLVAAAANRRLTPMPDPPWLHDVARRVARWFDSGLGGGWVVAV